MLMRLCFLAVVLLVGSFVSAHHEAVLPEGLSAQDWVQIERQIQAQPFVATTNDEIIGGWQANNPSHGFSINYRPDGQTVLTLDGEKSTIALQLEGYGYGDERIGLDIAPTLSANGNTVSYQWKPSLREWWINSEHGVEQWFELAERPTVDKNDQPLVVAMQLTTGLNAEVNNNTLSLTSADGNTTITYDRLKVWDATGQVLPSSMQLNGNQLALQVDDAHAVYPVTIDPTFAQQAYLKASNAESGDNFGSAVALDGDTLAVGAPIEDSSATGGQADNSVDASGAVYVFVRQANGPWVQQAYLKAPNADEDDRFGNALALSGDTLVVSSLHEDSSGSGGPADNSAENTGAVYVFIRTGTSWTQQAFLKASNAETEDRFGWSVDVDNDTLVVGTIDESSNTGADELDNSAEDAGAAYVFVRNGSGVWSQQAYLKASNAEAEDFFGDSVAVSGDRIVVGARFEDSSAGGGELDNSATGAGAAYVFERSGTSWTQQAFLKASNAELGDQFGVSAAISGDTLVVGAIGERSNGSGGQADNSAAQSGAAYVFVRDGGGAWNQQAYLKASVADPADFFGVSIALSGDVIAVGANLEDSGLGGGENDNSADQAGAAYVFERAGTVWTQQAFLKAPNTDAGDWFGRAVAVSGHDVAVGAIREDSSASGGQDDNSESSAGAVYIFGEPVFSIGGMVSGLVGSGLVLQNNGADDLPITMNGSFAFPAELFDGSAFDVTLASQPTGPNQTCTVTNGTSTIWGLDITNVEVECVTDQFTVSGTVTGLLGDQVVLQNNGGDDQIITADGSFTFSPQDDGTGYSVTVLTDPDGPSQTCSVNNDSGTLGGSDVSNVEVTCVTDQFTVGGNVSGLTGTGLVLQNNGGDNLPIAADGAFTFPTGLDDGSVYAVTVLTQPSAVRDQECTISDGSGTLAGDDVTDVEVQCEDITLNLSTTDLDLGLVFLGDTGTGIVTVSNPGTVDVTISAISSPGAPFSLGGGSCQPLPITLAAGEICTIEITLDPTEIGEFSGQIVVSSNAVSSPDTINLRGRGNFEPLVVPTLNAFGLLALMLLMLVIGALVMRNQMKVQQQRPADKKA